MEHNKSSREKWPGQLLFVACPQDWTVLFATELIILETGELYWDDLSKRRSFGIQRIQQEDENIFIVEREKDDRLSLSGGVYTFRPLTIPLYETQVKQKLDWEESFDTLEDLKTFILTKTFGT